MSDPYLAWAARHPAAAADLHAMLRAADELATTDSPKQGSEAAVQNAVLLECSRRGWGVWRNNKGVLPDARGVPVRFGLANNTPAVGKALRSSDLIACIPTLIGPEHLGIVLGRFGAPEIKRADWTWSGTEHERGQLAWAERVRSLGGWAGFVTSPEQLPCT